MLPRLLLSNRVREPLRTAFLLAPLSRKLLSTSEIRLRSSPLYEALILSSYRTCALFAVPCCSLRSLLRFSVCASSSRVREVVTSNLPCASFSWEPVLANSSSPPLETASYCCPLAAGVRSAEALAAPARSIAITEIFKNPVNLIPLDDVFPLRMNTTVSAYPAAPQVYSDAASYVVFGTMYGL